MIRRSCTGRSTIASSSSLSCQGCTVNLTQSTPSRSNSSTEVVCSADVCAPVSIFAFNHDTPISGNATHSRQPVKVLEWCGSLTHLSWQVTS